MPVYGLVKFLSEEAHADEFLSGRLLLRRLSTFKSMEDISDGRADPYEALTEWRQPKGLELTIAIPGHAPLKLTETDLAGPFSVSMNRHERMHLFCCYALHSGGLGELSNRAVLDEAEMLEAKQRLQIDAKCFAMGSWAVAIQPKPFIDALTAAIRARGWGAIARVVQYYDEATYSGRFADHEAPFMKQSRFAYQREFRVCVDSNSPDEVVNLDIGDMQEFAFRLPTGTLRSTLTIAFAAQERP